MAEDKQMDWQGSGDTLSSRSSTSTRSKVSAAPTERIPKEKRGKAASTDAGKITEQEKKSGVIRYGKEYLDARLLGLGRDKRVLTKAEEGIYLVEKYAENMAAADGYAVGFDFTTPQQKAVDAILKLNRDISTNREDKAAADYYKGNGAEQVYIPKQVEEARPERMAVIDSNWATFARYYWNKEQVTGKEIGVAKNTLISVAERNYPVTILLKDGKKIITYLPLLWLIHEEKGSSINIKLNPILTRGIGEAYISAADNTMQRLAEVHGSSRLPSGLKDFHDYLLRDISMGNNKRTYLLSTLCNMIARELLDNRHPKAARQLVWQTLSELQQLGIILRYSPTSSEDMDTKVDIWVNLSYK